MISLEVMAQPIKGLAKGWIKKGEDFAQGWRKHGKDMSLWGYQVNFKLTKGRGKNIEKNNFKL